MTVLLSGIGLIAAGLRGDRRAPDRRRDRGRPAGHGRERQAGGRSGLVDRHLADGQHRDHGDRRRRPVRAGRLAGLADRLRPGDPARDRPRPARTTPPTSTRAWRSLVCFYFLTAPTQGLRSLLTTLIVAGMAAFGIHELRKQTEEEYPGRRVRRRLRAHPRQGRQRRQGRQHRRARRRVEAAPARELRRQRAARRRRRGPDRDPLRRRGRTPAAAGAARLPARERRAHRRGVRGGEGAPARAAAAPARDREPAAGFEPATS